MVSVQHHRETDHYLKMGKTLISLDLCILNSGSDDDWFQDKHRQEIVALLQDEVIQKIDAVYAKKRALRSGQSDNKKTKQVPEKPMMLQGNTVKICYKFTRRPVTQRCLLMKPTFESVYMFPEKLHVYACQYHPSTVLHSTAKLLHTACKDLVPPSAAGVSGYFQLAATGPAAGGSAAAATATVGTATVGAATNSAARKRNKLRRIVSRKKIAEQPRKDVNSTDSDSWCPAKNPLTGLEAADPEGESGMRIAMLRGTGRLPGHAEDEEGEEEAGGGAEGRQPADESGSGRRQRAGTWEERRECAWDDLAPRRGRDGSELARKRKRVWEQSDGGRGPVALCVHAATDSPHGSRTEKPVKRQRTGEGGTPSKAAEGPIPGNPSRTRLVERGFGGSVNGGGAVARDGDAVAEEEETAADRVAGQDAVAKEGDAVSRQEDASERAKDAVAGDNSDCEIVGEPECEVFSDGDVDCLDRLPPGRECMSMLSSLHLQQLVAKNKHYLKQIFVGKQPCKRHSEYKIGGSSRANLIYEACYGPYTEDQVECVMRELVKVYCARHNKYLDYVSKVLLPEALTKICMDVLQVSAGEARVVMETTTPCGDSTILGRRFQMAGAGPGRR